MSRTTRAWPIAKHVKGVIFDMDGTLCLPQNYMFKEMRDALEIDKSIDILDHVHSLPETQQQEAQEKLQQIERRAMVKMQPQPGLDELMDSLRASEMLTTICTRNFPIPVQHLVSKFLDGYVMEPVVTREFKPPKPAPNGLLYIAERWNQKPSELVMVGDSIDDIMAGYRAGMATVLLRNPENGHLADIPETTAVIDRLPDLINLLKNA